jgi:hypothetical protein
LTTRNGTPLNRIALYSLLSLLNYAVNISNTIL